MTGNTLDLNITLKKEEIIAIRELIEGGKRFENMILKSCEDENDVIILPFDKITEGEENGLDNIDDSKTTAIHPAHYRQGKYEPIDVISDWNLNFNLGNTIKYIARAEYKGNKKEDLEKAAYYLNYELDRLV